MYNRSDKKRSECAAVVAAYLLPRGGIKKKWIGNHGKIQCQKAVHHPCRGHHGPAAGLRVHHEHADEPSARHQHAIPHGGHRLPRCQPGACGVRSLRCDGERAGYSVRRREHHGDLGRKLQPSAHEIRRRHRHEQRDGQDLQQGGPDRDRPAQHLSDPLHHRVQPEHERLYDGGCQPGGQRCLRSVGLRG